MINITGTINFSLIKKIVKSTSVYAAGNLINKAIPFLLLPILTRFLLPRDYGILVTFMAIFGIIYTLIYMGTTDAIVRAYFDREKSGFDFPKYVFNGFLINLTIFSIILLLWFLFRHYLARIIPVPFGCQLLIPLIGFFAAVYGIPSKLWVMMKKPLSHAVFNFSNTFIEIVLSVFFVVALGLSWKGRVWGMVLSKSLFFAIGLYILYKYKFLKISLNRAYLKNILNYGFPIMVHSLGFTIIAAIDKFFLNIFIDTSTTGIYSVSYYICSIIVFLTGALNLAWTPIFYEKLENASRALKIKLVKATYIYMMAVLIGVILFINFIPHVLNILVGEKFWGTKIFIFWLALGFGFQSMYTMVVSYIFYSRKTHILSIIAIITIILSITFNYLLIKLNGAVGVAQATCLVFFVRFLLVWYFGNKVYSMPWFYFTRG